jgi:hypothetical protein
MLSPSKRTFSNRVPRPKTRRFIRAVPLCVSGGAYLAAMARWTPLASSWAKFHRAGVHLHDLNAEMVRLAAAHPEPIDIERKVNPTEAFLRVTRVPEFREAGLLLGDAVNAYRAALDHLAWDLVKLGTHPRLTPNQATKVQYPLARSWNNLRGQRNQRLPGIVNADFALIRAYQPYRSDDRGRVMRSLRQLSDMDKHRYIVPAVMSHTDFRGTIRLTGCAATGIWMSSPRRALHVGTKLVRVRIVPTDPTYDVDIDSEMTVQPSLGRGVPVVASVEQIRAVVLELLSAFEERL